jgi:hypothetical protein
MTFAVIVQENTLHADTTPHVTPFPATAVARRGAELRPAGVTWLVIEIDTTAPSARVIEHHPRET